MDYFISICQKCFKTTMNPKFLLDGNYTLCPECYEEHMKELRELSDLFAKVERELSEQEESEE